MTRIDQFESVFKAASRDVYEHRGIAVRKVLVVTDLNTEAASAWAGKVRDLLAVLRPGEPEWTVRGGEERTVGELLERVALAAPELIVSYRNLYSEAWRWPHSLGSHLDVLTQVTDVPVLLLPRPEEETFWRVPRDTRRVLALTDHLTGDVALIRAAVHFTAPEGELTLVHIEDDRVFERYLGAIAKIPEIDTDMARGKLAERLLEDPRNYIVAIKRALVEAGVELTLRKVVRMGHRLADVEHLIAEREADLVVLHTKNADQDAMDGRAYGLAVELRSTPLLML